MKSIMLCLLACIVLFSLVTMTVSAQTGRNMAEIDGFLRERMDSLNIPGAALAIVRDGEVVHLEGYGVANSAGDPVTPQTPFLLASISKSMTAVAVMQLVEAGEIELDDPIQEYLPWFVPDTPITIRQLLNQTSGLDEAQGYVRNLDPDGPDALESSVRRLGGTELNRPPGEAFEYSNSNYDVLGLLVETVSGQPYGEYMQTHLFEPLAMVNSFVSLESARLAGMSSVFYPFFGRPASFDRWLPYSRATQPSAGLFASVEDMTHYLIMHLGGGSFNGAQILSPTGVEALHTPGVAINDTGLGYAMGWAEWPFTDAALADAAAPIALSHGGDWLGVNHIILIVPEKELGLVLLTNSKNPTLASASSNIAFDVALLALGREMQHYPPDEDWITRHLRSLSAALTLVLLILALVAQRRLRGSAFRPRDAWLFLGLGVFDLSLAGYSLLIRLPNNNTSVPQVLRFEPDLGLMLVVILLLTLGWGSLRSLWAVRRWRAGLQQS